MAATSSPAPSTARRSDGASVGAGGVDVKQRWKAFIMMGLSLLVTGSILWVGVRTVKPPAIMVRLEQGLEALDAGDDPQAVRIVSAYFPWSELPPSRQWIATYVMGMVNLHRAEGFYGQRSREFALLAARYLDEANGLDLPQARRVSALIDQGRACLLADRPDLSIVPLVAGVQLDSDRRLEAHRLLSEAYVKTPVPNWAEAYSHARAALADPKLFIEQREGLELLCGKALAEIGDYAGARQVLEVIPRDSHAHAEALFLLGHVALKIIESRPIPDPLDEPTLRAYRQALKYFDQAIARDNWSTEQTGRALLLAARCHVRLGDDSAALVRLERLERLFPDSDAALAGAFARAGVEQRLGRDDLALQILLSALERLPRSAVVTNAWITTGELTEALTSTLNRWLEREDYARATALADVSDPILGPVRAARITADAFAEWARRDERLADPLPIVEAAPLREAIGEHWRAAGRAYERLARTQWTTREYPENLWIAADCHRRGHDYERAMHVLDRYFDSGAKPRQAQAIFVQAECLLALGRPNEALICLEALELAVQADATRFSAPLIVALAQIQLGQLGPAEKSLLMILQGDWLSPESREWRESLFTLGRLLHEQGRFDEAILRLEEAVNRYPQAVESREAWYLLADAHRRSSEQLETALIESSASVDQTERRAAVRRGYEAALATYSHVCDELSERERAGRATPEEQVWLRNSLFGRGAMLFALERWEESLRAYLVAVTRYQDMPEVLDALVAVADCYRRLNRPIDARSTLLQARLVLNRLPQQTSFAATTNESRTDWARLLEALIAL